jgi:hypothetical protein
MHNETTDIMAAANHIGARARGCNFDIDELERLVAELAQLLGYSIDQARAALATFVGMHDPGTFAVHLAHMMAAAEDTAREYLKLTRRYCEAKARYAAASPDRKMRETYAQLEVAYAGCANELACQLAGLFGLEVDDCLATLNAYYLAVGSHDNPIPFAKWVVRRKD